MNPGFLQQAAVFAAIAAATVPAALPPQTVSAWDSLTPGPHPVGFAVSRLVDPTRRGADGASRAFSLSVWYPASSGGTQMRFMDYARQYAAEQASDSILIERFRQGFAPEVSFASVARLMHSPVRARGAARRSAQRRPLVLYVPGAGGSPLTHVITCEFLASHGYVVASIPAVGADGFGQTFDVEGQTALQRDLALALAGLRDLEWIDPDRVALIGFSFGANAALLLAMRDPGITALVSLDGAITFRNGAPMLRAATDLAPLALAAPMLRLEAAPDPTQDSTIVGALAASDHLIVRLRGAAHHDFISRGILLEVATGALSPQERARYRLTLELVRGFLNSRLAGARGFAPDSLITAFPAAAAELHRRPARIGRVTREQLVGWLLQPGGIAQVDSLQRLAGEVPILSPGTYDLIASRLLDSGRPSTAGVVLDLALRAFPHDPNLHAARGTAWLEAGDSGQAAASFSRSLSLDPDNPYALEGRLRLSPPVPTGAP